MRTFVFWLLVIIVVLPIAGSVAYAVRPLVDAAQVVSNITGVSAGSTGVVTPTPHASRDPRPSPTPAPTSPPIVSPHGRVNFLLLASDNDSKKVILNGFAGETLTNAVFPDTQSMFFVSFDTTTKQLYMISIPRDLYVTIPGYTSDKVDTASAYGNIAGSIKTVETDFGVHIDHYIWIGLQGFINVINSVGGLDVNVIHPMVENDFPDDIEQPNNPFAYRRFYIPPGPQHMDGETTELYVRARHSDGLGDFGRSQREQQVLLLIKQKLQEKVDAGDFDLASIVAQDMQHEAQTDLTLPDILGFARSILGLKSDQIHRWVLTDTSGYDTERTITMPNGTPNDVLIPTWNKILPLFACVDSTRAAGGCPGL